MSINSTAVVSTVSELLSYKDEEFVQISYQALLGRMPDNDGMRYYLGRMQSGIDKVEILQQLYKSTEAKKTKLRVDGLKEAIVRYKLLKLPILGAFLRAMGLKETKYNEVLAEGISKNNAISAEVLLRNHGVDFDSFPADCNVEKINLLNINDNFQSLDDAFVAIVQQNPVRKLYIHENNNVNAEFYTKLGAHQAHIRNYDKAIELFRLSLLFNKTSLAHEYLGNASIEIGRLYQAIEHYEIALDFNSKSPWVYYNLARAYKLTSQYINAIEILVLGIQAHPGSELLRSCIDSYIGSYWDAEDQKLSSVASSQNRNKLINDYQVVVNYICNTYSNIFNRNSLIPVSNKINSQKVLIVGWRYEALPQCYRYRIEQKIEQLKYAGFYAETVAWQDEELVLSLVNFYDLIIFYRVPALPTALKVIEYAKALGKITFYELDDLLFESVGVPDIETYGGQVPPSVYTSVTKDIGSHRAIASKCDYAIASTLPLLEKLELIVGKKKGFLHRNGLDKYNKFIDRDVSTKSDVKLFYGSGTLAHNSDFIIEALPAIEKIMMEFNFVKLVTMGYIKLPDLFIKSFGSRIVQLPINRDISVYYTYLAGADISLAVLHDDELTACKSELKWFEAATFAVPSVVSRTQNYLDVVKHEKDGFIVHGEAEWYSVLRKLVVDEKLRNSIGKNAFNRVKDEYSISTLSVNIKNVMKEAMSDYDEIKYGFIKEDKND